MLPYVKQALFLFFFCPTLLAKNQQQEYAPKVEQFLSK